MLDPILQELKKFREQIFNAIEYRRDASFDLIDAICSNTTASTPVQLSLNHHHRRSYSSITDVVSEFHKGGEKQSTKIASLLLSQAKKANCNKDFYLLAIDCTPQERCHSPTLSDRTIVYSPNQVAGNKPISIGHKYSSLCLMPELEPFSSSWVMPLSTSRVSSEQDDSIVGAKQLQDFLDELSNDEPSKMVVSCVDSGYCKAEYINTLHANANNNNLVSIIRARSNRVVWQKADSPRSVYGNKRGHERWYGDKFCFRDISTWHQPDDELNKTIESKRSKPLTVNLKLWRNMVTRDIRGLPMHKHNFNLLRVSVCDESGKSVFHKPMWLMIYGERGKELSPWQTYQSYLQRYNIEHYFRFKKRNLLIDKLQTSETQHEENWWQLGLLSYAILFASQKAIEKNPYPWETYLKQKAQIKKPATPAMVQRQFNLITSKIGTPAKSPKLRGNPLGRSAGQKMTKKSHKKIIIKSKIPQKSQAA